MSVLFVFFHNFTNLSNLNESNPMLPGCSSLFLYLSFFQVTNLYYCFNDHLCLKLISQLVQSLSRVQLFATPWTAARQASLSFTISCSLPRFMPTESVMPSNRLILCHPLLLPSIFPSIRVFSSESGLCIRWPRYWSFSFRISLGFSGDR